LDVSIVEAYQVELQRLQELEAVQAAQKQELDAQLLRVVEQIGSIRLGANPYVAKLQEHDVAVRAALLKGEGELAANKQVEAQALRQHQNALAAIRMRTSSEVQHAQSRLSVAQVSYDRAKKALDDFACGKLTHCPTCGQELPNKIDGSHLQVDLENSLTEVRALQGLLEEVKNAYSIAIDTAIVQEQLRAQAEVMQIERAAVSLRQTLEAAKQASSAERQELEAQKSAYDASESAKNEAFAKLAAERSACQAQLGALGAKQHETAVLRTNYEMALRSHEAGVVRRAELLLQVTAAEQTLAKKRLDVAEWSWLVKNVGDKGLKAWKLETVCCRLNDLLAQALADIDGSFRLWVKPYRLKAGAENKTEELLTHDDVISDITIYVQEGNKQAVPIYMYSGGEASVIALALLVALWQLADEQGSGTNLLLLDEVVGFLDQRNSQIVVRFLEGLKTVGKTVLVVSHAQVADSVDFDAVWTVRKVSGISTLQVGDRS
jgi:hypothetical protein